MSNPLNFTDFLKRSTLTHGTFYNYCKVVFEKWDKKVEMLCPNHGEFWQTPLSHTRGNGCPACGNETVKKMKTKNDDWEKTKSIIEKAISELNGKFPTHKDVVAKKVSVDVGRVVRKLGGYAKARERFEFEPSQKPKHYWEDWNNVVNFLNTNFPLLIQSGQCPTIKMMRDTGTDPSAFLENHGGIIGICKKLNLVAATGFKTRDGHFVRSYYELLLDEYLYSRDIEHIPEVKPFINYNFRCDQKIGEVYIEIWGYPPRCKTYDEKRTKKKLLYTKNKLHLIEIDYDFFDVPYSKIESQFDLLFQKHGFEIKPVRSYCISEIFKNISYPWTEEIIKDEIKSYIQLYNEFPTQKNLRRRGISALSDRISQFGGFKYFRKIMGYGEYKKSDPKWSLDKIIENLKNICEQLGYFPTKDDMPKSLQSAMYRFKKDAPDINWYKNKLGYEITKKSKGYWNNETIVQNLKEVINEANNIFPTASYLKKIKREDLSNAIQNTGGFNFWREQLGYPVNKITKNNFV